MSMRNGCPTAAASRFEGRASLVRARNAAPEDTAPDVTRITFQPSDLALSAASRADVSTTGSGPVDRVTELEPSFTTIDLMARNLPLPGIRGLRHDSVLSQVKIPEGDRPSWPGHRVNVDPGLRHGQQFESVQQPGRCIPECARAAVGVEKLVSGGRILGDH